MILAITSDKHNNYMDQKIIIIGTTIVVHNYHLLQRNSTQLEETTLLNNLTITIITPFNSQVPSREHRKHFSNQKVFPNSARNMDLFMSILTIKILLLHFIFLLESQETIKTVLL